MWRRVEGRPGWVDVVVDAAAVVVLAVKKRSHFHRRLLPALFRNMRVRSLLSDLERVGNVRVWCSEKTKKSGSRESAESEQSYRE